MPEYVYALHDFYPENEDEIAFHAGDRIEVIEKDDQFGDGWWKGKNLDGSVGLFPQSYTAPAPPIEPSLRSQNDIPISNSGLVPLDEESETESAPKTPPEPHLQNADIASHVELTSPSLHHRVASSSDGEMMKATMTDVQQAIEQLGRGHDATEDADGTRSFSFTSSKDDVDTDYSDLEGLEQGGAWHKGMRDKLAENARRAMEEAEKLEAILNESSSPQRTTAPPIDVELSDESDTEDNNLYGDEDTFNHPTATFKRTHPYIPEEDEVAEFDRGDDGSRLPNAEASTSVVVATAATTVTVATVAAVAPVSTPTPTPSPPLIRSTSPALSALRDVDVSSTKPVPTSRRSEEGRERSRSPVPSAPRTNGANGMPDLKTPEPKRASSPRSVGTTVLSSLDGAVVRAAPPQPQGNGQGHPQVQSQVTQIAQTPEVFQETPSVAVIESATSTGPAASPEGDRGKQPNEWSVNDVVEWLKSKGFDHDVQNKFIEQEITGDVLLDLDANLLKTEIGIMAFGKRVRIANAVAELRQTVSGSPLFHQSPSGLPQPASPEMMSHHSFSGGSLHSQPAYSASTPSHHPHHVLQSTHSHSPLSGQFFPQYPTGVLVGPSGGGNGHARTYSQSQQSQHSYRSSTASGVGAVIVPGAGPGQSVLYNTQGSIPGALQPSASLPTNPPWGGSTPVAGQGVTNGTNGDEQGSMSGGASKDGSVRGTTTAGSASLISKEEKVGLGLLMYGGKDKNDEPALKSRPEHLSLSPSFGALSDTVKVVNGDEDDEDRGHMSETDMTMKKTRRKLFGLSQDSSQSRDSASRRSSSSAQASPKKDVARDRESPRSQPRSKKSLESSKTGGERLSIFGTSFTGTLGKSRKPPPRYSTDDHEKSSLFPLPLFSSSLGRKPSGAPNGSSIGFKDEKGDKARTDSTVRKRTSSFPPLSNRGKEGTGLVAPTSGGLPLKQGQSILEQIGEPDHTGWMRKKGERYNNWKLRYFVLTGPHMYYLRSSGKAETKIKGYINIMGYKVTVDEDVDPGKYGFRIHHDTDKTHYFSSEDKMVIRDWMKAIMKATIGRDYSKPVISSCSIPTIPLTVAQAMNPAPRPPSPTARAATQKAHRTKDLEALGVKDLNDVPQHATLVLMGLQPRASEGSSEERTRIDSVFPSTATGKGKKADDDGGESLLSLITPRAAKTPIEPPPRPAKRQSVRGISTQLDATTVEWANSQLPISLRVVNPSEQSYSALALFRIAESIKGQPASPPIPDSAFPSGPQDDKAIEGLFALFDFLVNNEVKMGSVSINDIKLQRPDKVAQIVKALKSWEDRRKLTASPFPISALNPPVWT